MNRSELREIIMRITEIIGEEGVPEAACFLFGDSVCPDSADEDVSLDIIRSSRLGEVG